MSEKRVEVRTFKVFKSCDSCTQGFMKFTGMTFPTYPEKYEHVCDMCQAKENYLKKYPSIEVEE